MSAVTLALPDRRGMRAADWTALGYAALESGINSFEVVGCDPAIVDGLSVALRSVSRRLVVVGLRLGNLADGRRDFSGNILCSRIQAMVVRSGLGYLDLAVLDDPRSEELSSADLQALKEFQQQGQVQMLGVRGKDEAIDAYISTGAFEVLALPYNMTSGWQERHRIRLAQDRDMGIVGYDFYPEVIANRPGAESTQKLRIGWLRKAEPASGPAQNGFGFLDETPNWTPEQICLAYALTEPGLASVEITPANPAELQELADAPDRDLPAGLGSRVEMARFSATPSQNSGKP